MPAILHPRSGLSLHSSRDHLSRDPGLGLEVQCPLGTQKQSRVMWGSCPDCSMIRRQRMVLCLFAWRGGSQLLLLVGCTDNHPAQRQREGPGFRRHTHRRLRGATRHLHGVPTIPVKRAASHAVVKCRVIVGCTNDIELDLLSGSKGPLVIIVKLIDGAKRDW